MSAPVSRSSSQARTSAGFSSSPSKTPFVKWSFLSDLPKEILEIELHLGFGFQRRQGWETRLHCTWQQELCPGNNNGRTVSSEQISKMAFFVIRCYLHFHKDNIPSIAVIIYRFHDVKNPRGEPWVVNEDDHEIVDVVHHDLQLLLVRLLDGVIVIGAALVLDQPLQHLLLVLQLTSINNGDLIPT